LKVILGLLFAVLLFTFFIISTLTPSNSKGNLLIQYKKQESYQIIEIRIIGAFLTIWHHVIEGGLERLSSLMLIILVKNPPGISSYHKIILICRIKSDFLLWNPCCEGLSIKLKDQKCYFKQWFQTQIGQRCTKHSVLCGSHLME